MSEGDRPAHLSLRNKLVHRNQYPLKSWVKSSQCSGQGHLMGNAPMGASDSKSYTASRVHHHLCKEEESPQALIRKRAVVFSSPSPYLLYSVLEDSAIKRN